MDRNNAENKNILYLNGDCHSDTDSDENQSEEKPETATLSDLTDSGAGSSDLNGDNQEDNVLGSAIREFDEDEIPDEELEDENSSLSEDQENLENVNPLEQPEMGDEGQKNEVLGNSLSEDLENVNPFEAFNEEVGNQGQEGEDEVLGSSTTEDEVDLKNINLLELFNENMGDKGQENEVAGNSLSEDGDFENAISFDAFNEEMGYEGQGDGKDEVSWSFGTKDGVDFENVNKFEACKEEMGDEGQEDGENEVLGSSTTEDGVALENINLLELFNENMGDKGQENEVAGNSLSKDGDFENAISFDAFNEEMGNEGQGDGKDEVSWSFGTEDGVDFENVNKFEACKEEMGDEGQEDGENEVLGSSTTEDGVALKNINLLELFNENMGDKGQEDEVAGNSLSEDGDFENAISFDAFNEELGDEGQGDGEDEVSWSFGTDDGVDFENVNKFEACKKEMGDVGQEDGEDKALGSSTTEDGVALENINLLELINEEMGDSGQENKVSGNSSSENGDLKNVNPSEAFNEEMGDEGQEDGEDEVSWSFGTEDGVDFENVNAFEACKEEMSDERQEDGEDKVLGSSTTEGRVDLENINLLELFNEEMGDKGQENEILGISLSEDGDFENVNPFEAFNEEMSDEGQEHEVLVISLSEVRDLENINPFEAFNEEMSDEGQEHEVSGSSLSEDGDLENVNPFEAFNEKMSDEGQEHEVSGSSLSEDGDLENVNPFEAFNEEMGDEGQEHEVSGSSLTSLTSDVELSMNKLQSVEDNLTSFSFNFEGPIFERVQNRNVEESVWVTVNPTQVHVFLDEMEDSDNKLQNNVNDERWMKDSIKHLEGKGCNQEVNQGINRGAQEFVEMIIQNVGVSPKVHDEHIELMTITKDELHVSARSSSTEGSITNSSGEEKVQNKQCEELQLTSASIDENPREKEKIQTQKSGKVQITSANITREIIENRRKEEDVENEQREDSQATVKLLADPTHNPNNVEEIYSISELFNGLLDNKENDTAKNEEAQKLLELPLNTTTDKKLALHLTVIPTDDENNNSNAFRVTDINGIFEILGSLHPEEVSGSTEGRNCFCLVEIPNIFVNVLPTACSITSNHSQTSTVNTKGSNADHKREEFNNNQNDDSDAKDIFYGIPLKPDDEYEDNNSRKMQNTVNVSSNKSIAEIVRTFFDFDKFHKIYRPEEMGEGNAQKTSVEGIDNKGLTTIESVTKQFYQNFTITAYHQEKSNDLIKLESKCDQKVPKDANTKSNNSISSKNKKDHSTEIQEYVVLKGNSNKNQKYWFNSEMNEFLPIDSFSSSDDDDENGQMIVVEADITPYPTGRYSNGSYNEAGSLNSNDDELLVSKIKGVQSFSNSENDKIDPPNKNTKNIFARFKMLTNINKFIKTRSLAKANIALIKNKAKPVALMTGRKSCSSLIEEDVNKHTHDIKSTNINKPALNTSSGSMTKSEIEEKTMDELNFYILSNPLQGRRRHSKSLATITKGNEIGLSPIDATGFRLDEEIKVDNPSGKTINLPITNKSVPREKTNLERQFASAGRSWAGDMKLFFSIGKKVTNLSNSPNYEEKKTTSSGNKDLKSDVTSADLEEYVIETENNNSSLVDYEQQIQAEASILDSPEGLENNGPSSRSTNTDEHTESLPQHRVKKNKCRICGEFCEEFSCIGQKAIIKILAVRLPIVLWEAEKYSFGICADCDKSLEKCSTFVLNYLLDRTNRTTQNHRTHKTECFTCGSSVAELLVPACRFTMRKLTVILEVKSFWDLAEFYSCRRYLCEPCQQDLEVLYNMREWIIAANEAHHKNMESYSENRRNFVNTLKEKLKIPVQENGRLKDCWAGFVAVLRKLCCGCSESTEMSTKQSFTVEEGMEELYNKLRRSNSAFLTPSNSTDLFLSVLRGEAFLNPNFAEMSDNEQSDIEVTEEEYLSSTTE